jgi:hypothetical protein
LKQRGLDRTLGRFVQEIMSAVTFEADIEWHALDGRAVPIAEIGQGAQTDTSVTL